MGSGTAVGDAIGVGDTVGDGCGVGVAASVGLGVAPIVAVGDGTALVAVAWPDEVVVCDLVIKKLAAPMPATSATTRHTQTITITGALDRFGGGVAVLNVP